MKQKRFLWILLAVALVSGSLYYLSSREEKRAVQAFAQAKEAAASQQWDQVTALLKEIKTSKLKPEEQIEVLYLLGISQTGAAAKKSWEALLEKPPYREKARFELAKLEPNRKKALTLFADLAESAQDEEIVAISLFELASQKKPEEALKDYQKIIKHYPNSTVAASAIERIGNINTQLLFSKQADAYSKIHVVRPGESLASIANKYRISVELLKESNNLTSNIIHPNDRLKVCVAQFSLEVSKTKNILLLKANDELFKLYHVGTGKLGSTPIGHFQVTSKLVEPTWFPPEGGMIPFGSKDNLLGTRWLGINSPGYGIHGTWDPESIGSQSSAGCIRMHNQDVEELYKIVTIGAPVTIEE